MGASHPRVARLQRAIARRPDHTQSTVGTFGTAPTFCGMRFEKRPWDCPTLMHMVVC